MCGIVGVLDWSGGHPPDTMILKQMLGSIRHRGPDEFGLYIDHRVGLGCARLSILDLVTGQQPITNEDQSVWIVCNGEVFNHPELRAGLEQAGHQFTTRSDIEAIVHLYEDLGPECLHQLNGQFAIALWDTRRQELFLARDRLGICPLYYALLPRNEGILFASEIKALLQDPRLVARFDLHALAQAFTFWAPLPPRTIFQDVQQIPQGHYVRIRTGEHPGFGVPKRYWLPTFPEAGSEARVSDEEASEQLRSLLCDATRVRLRADVTVGSYLSGGLDSTLIASLIRRHTSGSLHTFSIGFEEPAFDEREYQSIAAEFLTTDHRQTLCRNSDIGRVFPEVVWHTEAPLLRTSPAPMYLLSRLVRDFGIKVVLTGEGADEFLGGYNIYKEDKVRRFWAREPDSAWRPKLLRRLYPYVSDLSRGGDAFLTAFFGRGLDRTDLPGFSHYIRWSNTSRLQRLFSTDLKEALIGYDAAEEFLDSLNGVLSGWSPLSQAQYIEVATFMSPYLLSSQGDRMMAAHSVEGRFPFLDHRVIEFCNHLPSHLKLRGLNEKYILKRSAEGLVPAAIWQRDKRPYRAPIHSAFFSQPLDYVQALLSSDAIRTAGVFAPQAVDRLTRKCRDEAHLSEGDGMALAGVLSVQLLHHQFINGDRLQSVKEPFPIRVHRGRQ